MISKFRAKPASEQEISLYIFIGESVCMVQHLEDALSHSIVMKKVERHLREEADKQLEKHRTYTLGNAINKAEKSRLYPEPLLKELRDFLSDRNWLIHKSIAQGRDEWDLNVSREKVYTRVNNITTQAQNLIQLIEEDMMKYAEENGVDMTKLKDEIKKFCGD